MPPRKKAEGEAVATKKDGKITINIPLSSFIKEHKNLSTVLESGVQDAILKEAEAQRKELKDIINQVKEIQGLEKSKAPKATSTMETQTMEEKPKMNVSIPPPIDISKIPILEPKPKKQVKTPGAPDLRKLQPKKEVKIPGAPDLRKLQPKK